MIAAPREAYPLTWPAHQPRVETRRAAARLKFTLGAARDALLHELRLLGARNIIISTNVPLLKNGLLAADAREPKDPAVAVYFDRIAKGAARLRPFVIACDTYSKVRWNVRAVGATVEALRTIQRHGASSMLEQAFTGFAALPPKPPEEPWWEVLGVRKTASRGEIVLAYRARAREVHPDQGGSDQAMARVNDAYERYKRACDGATEAAQ